MAEIQSHPAETVSRRKVDALKVFVGLEASSPMWQCISFVCFEKGDLTQEPDSLIGLDLHEVGYHPWTAIYHHARKQFFCTAQANGYVDCPMDSFILPCGSMHQHVLRRRTQTDRCTLFGISRSKRDHILHLSGIVVSESHGCRQHLCQVHTCIPSALV